MFSVIASLTNSIDLENECFVDIVTTLIFIILFIPKCNKHDHYTPA